MNGIKRGLWILFQKYNLLFKWLKELYNMIDNIDPLKPNPEFRLRLTTSSLENSPLEFCIKTPKML